jgi:hypothetical protein
MTGHQRHRHPPPGVRKTPPRRKPAPEPKPPKKRAVPPVQRAVGNTALAPLPPLDLPPTPAPLKAYTVDLVIDGKERSYPNLSPVQARERLLFYWRQCHQDLDLFRHLHQELIDQRREHRTAGFWAEHLGHVELPDIEMWNEIGRGSLSAATTALDTKDEALHRQYDEYESQVDRNLSESLRNNPLMQQALAFDPDQMRIEQATRALEQASRDLQEAWNRVEVYQGGVEKGASRAVTGIRVSIVVLSAAASGGGVGFAGRGAGLLARSGAVALTAGGLGATTEAFTQYGEIRIGARTEFDIGGIVKRGVTDTVVGFVGGVAGGKFADVLKGSVARWVSGLPKGQLAALGITEEQILGKATTVILEWAGGVGATPLTTVTGAAMQRALTGKSSIHTFGDFASQVFDDMLTSGIMSAAMISTDHALASVLPGRSGGGSTPGDGSTPSRGGSSSSSTSSTDTATTHVPTGDTPTGHTTTTATATTATRPATTATATATTATAPRTTATATAATRVPTGDTTVHDAAPPSSHTKTRTPSPAQRPSPPTVGDLPPEPAAPGPAPRSSTTGELGGSTESVLGGSPSKFLPHPTSRSAVSAAPSLEAFDNYTVVRTMGGPNAPTAEGKSYKEVLRDSNGKLWLFKPAGGESNMGFGPPLGIRRYQRYRRAPAAALIAERLGIATPAVKLVTVSGRPGSLQEWWEGYQTVSELKASDRPRFSEFWESQQRKDLDVMDHVIAQQDRHKGNIYVKDRPGGGLDLAAIDQDASFPTGPDRFHPHRTREQLAGWQRELPSTISRDMAGRLRALARNWPEAELRQWLTQPETDGARTRLAQVIAELDAGRITVTP